MKGSEPNTLLFLRTQIWRNWWITSCINWENNKRVCRLSRWWFVDDATNNQVITSEWLDVDLQDNQDNSASDGTNKIFIVRTVWSEEQRFPHHCFWCRRRRQRPRLKLPALRWHDQSILLHRCHHQPTTEINWDHFSEGMTLLAQSTNAMTIFDITCDVYLIDGPRVWLWLKDLM
jgi:hypothetical protein